MPVRRVHGLLPLGVGGAARVRDDAVRGPLRCPLRAKGAAAPHRSQARQALHDLHPAQGQAQADLQVSYRIYVSQSLAEKHVISFIHHSIGFCTDYKFVSLC